MDKQTRMQDLAESERNFGVKAPFLKISGIIIIIDGIDYYLAGLTTMS